MIRIIAAVSSNSVIGVDGKIPFNYPADMKHFKNLTINSTVIMGRKTFESIGKSLPNRQNIIVTSQQFKYINDNTVATFSLEKALTFSSDENIYLIGGASIYQEGMKYANEIHLTIVPDEINDKNAVKFPWINPLNFELSFCEDLPGDNRLKYCIYKRK